MQRYYIPHKVSTGDITHLADNDSIFAISKGTKEEQIIEIEAPNGVFNAQVTYIEKNSVEIEILNQLSISQEKGSSIVIIQGVSSITKFGLFLEKITEIGVTKVIPIISELSLIDKDKAVKDSGVWKKIIKDATEQSRNPNPPELFNIEEIGNLKNVVSKESLKLCFVTENVETVSLSQGLIGNSKNIVMAFGPESGFSFKDIQIFKSLGFKFVRIKGNILRTETTPIVATSIIKFILKEL